ncbi:HutP family protein [Halanaerobium praevalens]|uniref:Hut operon positive regulatory protein n=1 Tax=Halanaerobium praevalens (strain ATCC 33744 / DSM 2228 / GSL) TaxID=572479 RepID=E3DNN2_HALPG|nr:HutP family protein [Halanaerobium praevalens]ADO77582.1 HutP family protein [Halanaerobium praevalens DSM 2228]
MEANSLKTAKSAIKMSISSRSEEKKLKKEFAKKDINTAAVDFGGEFNSSVPEIIERAVIAAKRENIIEASHTDQGAVAGAAHDALSQMMPRTIGLNVGGKIGIARSGEHIVVAIFFGVGMFNLDEVTVGLGHRSLK